VKISDLRFADDIALLAESKDNLQKSVDKVAEVSTSMGMQIITYRKFYKALSIVTKVNDLG